MRISDWSSDVCSSDLADRGMRSRHLPQLRLAVGALSGVDPVAGGNRDARPAAARPALAPETARGAHVRPGSRLAHRLGLPFTTERQAVAVLLDRLQADALDHRQLLGALERAVLFPVCKDRKSKRLNSRH